jgi:integrase/recombinase XerC
MPATEQVPETLQGYLAYLHNERNYSPLTAENYARDIRRLLALAGTTPLPDLKSHHIRRYIAQLHGSGLGGRSLARVLSAWRGFYGYLMRDHGCKSNPCVGLRAPKAPKTLPHALSPDEAVKLVEMPVATSLDARDKAMFELLYSSGLRLAELVSLDPIDMDFADASVRVTGKGNKTRIVPMGSHAIDALKAWLTVRSQIARPDETALFVGKNGARISPRRESPAACTRTCCGTPSPRMCCNPRATCARYRRCWDTPAFPPRRSTPISIFNISPRSTTVHIRVPRKKHEPDKT